MRSCMLALGIALATAMVAPTGARGMIILEEHFEGDAENFAVGSSWSNSYCNDGWRTDLNGGVIAALDDSCSGCECNFLVQTDGVNECIDSDPIDNHIQTGSTDWQNYSYTVRFRNEDDDAMGIVFRYVNSANFYLFSLSQSSSPTAAGCVSEFNGARLIRVRQDVGGVTLKEVAGLTYQTGVEHRIRATVSFRHIKIEFDHNGDGQFGANEVFFDQDDDAQAFIPAGAIGLYAFNNGAHEGSGESNSCSAGGCWFDDAVVDLLPPNNQNCGAIGWEGSCTGNTLKYCSVLGELQEKSCGEGSCCRWVAAQEYFTCVPGNQCNSCKDDCEPESHGCSGNLTHSVTCGQSDPDSCQEPVFTACPPDSACNPLSGECTTPCQAQCEDKECGDDGCGSSCGSCALDEDCVDGVCQVDLPGAMGENCESAADCITMMCVVFDGEKVCSKACSGDASCPLNFVCEQVTVSGMSLEGCVPSGECVPDCTGKVCGSNGCEGTCGGCDPGFSCKAGTCKADAGASCEGADECASGLCIAFQSGVYCSTPCSTDEGCPETWHCSPWIDPATPNICAPKGTMVAHETCGEVAECMSNCPPNNPACTTNCFFFGAAIAQQDYADLLICTQTKCFPECGDDNGCVGECLLDACFQIFAECFPGSTSCGEAIACMAACGSNEFCVDACYEDAFPAGKKQLNALLQCVSTICDEEIAGDCFEAAVEEPCAPQWGECDQPCQQVCDGLECGNDGCGGTCGDCLSGQVCQDGLCVINCIVDCDGKECGDDGCGGECGQCIAELSCIAGICALEEDCVPNAGQECVGDSLFWFDSCDQQGEPAETCKYGCTADECNSPPTQSDISTADDYGIASDSGVITLSAPRAAGCSASPGADCKWSMLLLLAALLALRTQLRSRYA